MVLLIQQVIDPALSAEEKKLSFVSIWFSFAFALFLLNKCKKNDWMISAREKKRLTFDSIPAFGAWQATILILVGLVGWLVHSLIDYLLSWLADSSQLDYRMSSPPSPSLWVVNQTSAGWRGLQCCRWQWRRHLLLLGPLSLVQVQKKTKDQPVLWQGERESVNTNINPSNGNQRLLL